MTIKEIDKQIQELKNQRSKLEKQERKQFEEQAKSNIGRCFIINGKQYVKVINIPQDEWDLSGHRHYNSYQYPALYLSDELVPFYENTLFSGAWGIGNSHGETYKEIAPEEFNSEFEKRLNKFKDKVCNVVAKKNNTFAYIVGEKKPNTENIGVLSQEKLDEFKESIKSIKRYGSR